MSATTEWLEQAEEARKAISEAKRQDLRSPMPTQQLSREARRALNAAMAAAGAPGFVQMLLLSEIMDRLYGGQSGLDEKLSRFSQSLGRKLR